MASPSGSFELSSTETALVLIVPQAHRHEIDELRSVYDKSYRKWPPHINLLYPFVDHPRLAEATLQIRKALNSAEASLPILHIDRTGSFRHRKNATIFLRPSPESEEGLTSLRRTLVESLGLHESDGTFDGIYRPHISVGQASLVGNATEKLSGIADKIPRLGWQPLSLAVLRRNSKGEMEIVDTIPFSNHLDDIQPSVEEASREEQWRLCYQFRESSGWEALPDPLSRPCRPMSSVLISSYNLLSEPTAPPIAARLQLAIDALLTAISGSTAPVKALCLQEVDEEMLPLLLADAFIRNTYPFCSHSPASPLSSRRNLMILASQPFKHIKLDFAESHKSTLAAKLYEVEVAVVNVHLTSALTDESVEAKTRQMSTISKFVTTNSELKDSTIVLAGDFNLTTSPRTIETALARKMITAKTARDVSGIVDPETWKDAFLEHLTSVHVEDARETDAGATFDRQSNPLAALTMTPIDKEPQRYDRILFGKDSNVQVDSFERFGFPDEFGICASDHYGVSATLQLIPKGKASTAPNHFENLGLDKILLVEDDTVVDPNIGPYLPSDKDVAQRIAALDQIQQVLSSHSRLRDIHIAPLGSYAMCTYFASSDVDILVIGSLPPKNFFPVATSALQRVQHASPQTHFINSLVPVIETSVSGIKFDIQYCHAPELLKSLSLAGNDASLRDLVFDSEVISQLPLHSLRPLNTYRDTLYIIQKVPDITAYRTAHRFLSLYLKRRGLYSTKFGYLGGIHLSLMLNRIVKLIDIQYGSVRTITPATLIRTFFSYYANFDWSTQTVNDPVLHATTPPYTRSPREPIVIQSLHTPTARQNVASSNTKLTAATLTREFALAAQKLDKGEWTWCLRNTTATATDFLKAYTTFVRISLDMWNIDEAGPAKVRDITGALESRIPLLSISLGRIEQLDGRAWPFRFREADHHRQAKSTASITNSNSNGEDDPTQLKGLYLFGLSITGSRSTIPTLNPSAQKLIENKVLSAVRSFETVLREAKVLSTEYSWIDVAIVKQKKILQHYPALVIDDRNWVSPTSSS
jgi:endonuclease/exonuclease/phosphatase family metal-dependent hydrolase